MDEANPPDAASLAFEREKWEAEQRRLDRDFELREKELTFKESEAHRLAFEREKWEAEQPRLDKDFELREKELTFKESEAHRARLWNPLAIAILGATVAAIGSAYVSWQNSQASLQVETLKAEAARIFEVVKTGDPDKAAANLRFLLETGLIRNHATVVTISDYLHGRKQGEGLSLPVDETTPTLRPAGILGLYSEVFGIYCKVATTIALKKSQSSTPGEAATPATQEKAKALSDAVAKFCDDPVGSLTQAVVK